MTDLANEPYALIAAAVENAIDAAQKITDPLDRQDALASAMEAMRNGINDIKGARSLAIQEARDTLSATQIAERTGLTVGRIYQIIDGR